MANKKVGNPVTRLITRVIFRWVLRDDLPTYHRTIAKLYTDGKF